MSKEIDKLIEQVGTDTSGKWMRIDQVHSLSALIIQECMDVVSRKCASPTAYDALAEHFGSE